MSQLDNSTEKLDPRGLSMHDVAKLESLFKPGKYKPGTTIDQVMYREGQQSVIDFIKTHIIGAH